MKRSGSINLACLFLLAILGSGCEEQRSQIDSALFDPANEDEIEDATGALPDPDDLEEGLDKPIDELGEDPLRVSVVQNQFADSQLIITLGGEVDTRLDTVVERLEWQQIQGPTAAIMEPNSASTRIALPRVTRREVLRFRLSAVAADGFVDSAVARVTVLPLDNSIELINASFLEADAQIVFEIQLADPAEEEWQLEYTTADGTALAGQDYEAVSGVVVFGAGDQRKSIPVNLLEGAVRDETGYFYLKLTSLNSDRPFATQAVGLIEPDPVSESPSVSFFTFEGSCNQTQQQRGGTVGIVRFSLQWGPTTSTELGLEVDDPCGNTLDREQLFAECQSTDGESFIWSESWGDGVFRKGEEVNWNNGAPAGEYQVALTHLSGQPAEFNLCIYYGDESQMYSGTMGNAETLILTQIEFAGAEPELPDSSGSSSSSSSSTSASSSTSSSSTSTSGSSSSSGTASGSTSSSSSSSSSSTSSGGSGSSTSSTSSSSGSSSSSSGAPVELPDLVATIQRTNDPIFDNGDYGVPVEVTVTNRGTSAAAVFSTSTEYAHPQLGRFLVPLLATDGELYDLQTTAELEPGQSVTFVGVVLLNPDLAGETVELTVVADSCSGDGSSVAESYCRVEESDETNNRSAPIRVLLPLAPVAEQS